MIEAFFKYNFLQYAVYSGLLASIVCGIIGTIIVEKKLVMMSGGIAHNSFGGVGLGYYLGVEPILTALLFAVVSALGLVTIKRKTFTEPDTLLGIFWALGMALGILFISFTPGYPPDISTYLFGDILTVTGLDLKLILILTILVTTIILLFFNYWKAFLFDQEFTRVLGIRTVCLEYLLYILIALTVVVLIRVVGIVLVLALLTAPPATARFFTCGLKRIMLLAVFFGALSIMLGLWLSYSFDFASGAGITLTAGGIYFIVFFCRSSSRQNG